MENEYTMRNKTARLSGLLFFIWILTGLFNMFYIPSQINITSDAGETVQNILNNEFLFRVGMANGLISATIWVLMVWLFYQLFQDVNERLAKLLFAFVLVQIPTAFIMEALNLTALSLVKGNALMGADVNLRQELVMLLLKINDSIESTLILFWGLWLLPLGLLVYKSHFLPKFIGIWLVVNGFAYIMLSFMTLLWPHYYDRSFKIVIPAILGEVVLMGWLVVKGVRKTDK